MCIFHGCTQYLVIGKILFLKDNNGKIVLINTQTLKLFLI